MEEVREGGYIMERGNFIQGFFTSREALIILVQG